MDFDKPQTRRGFLDRVIALGSMITGAAMVIPGVLYLWPAARGGGPQKVEVEGASDLAIGQAKVIMLSGLAVVVVRQRSGFRAFSAVCTHLGCLVRWDSSRNEFLCPCHAATFDKNGAVVSGPPPAPLPELSVKEVGDRVFVTAT